MTTTDAAYFKIGKNCFYVAGLALVDDQPRLVLISAGDGQRRNYISFDEVKDLPIISSYSAVESVWCSDTATQEQAAKL